MKKNFKKDFNNYSKKKKQFNRNNDSISEKNPELVNIKEVSFFQGKNALVIGKVSKIIQTGGPTVFVINDGTGNLSLKGFIGPGQRAYPEIVEESIIKAVVKIGEFNGEIEGEIKSIHKLNEEQREYFLKSIKEIERERAKVVAPEFLVKSPILEKLKNHFIKAATEIKLAIIQDRPIIVRHHNDADGYSSGFALEKAILPLIIQQHGSDKAGWEFFTRAPCAAPFYEIDDSIRDTALSLRNAAKFSNKMPLIIIADNGSSPEDLMAIKQGKVHGSDFIVVDHHYSDKDVISKEVLVHINPFLVGEDGAKYSAGMLCTELARFINPDAAVDHIPALAAFADMIDNPVVVDHYLKIAEKMGYTKQLLHDVSSVIDFVSTKLRFMEAREYVEVLFGKPIQQQKKLIEVLAPHIKVLEAKAISIAKSVVKREKIGKTTVQFLNIEESFSRGIYPKPGKINGLLHDYAKRELSPNVISLGVLTDAVTFRASEDSKFSVHEFIKFSQKSLPEAFIEGGGHHVAGAIRFVPSQRENVLNVFREFIAKIK